MPATLAQQAAQAAKTIKQPESQTSIASLPVASTIKSIPPSSTPTITSVPSQSTAKRTPSKTSVFSKIFK